MTSDNPTESNADVRARFANNATGSGDLVPIAYAIGDGIGPEIMGATLDVLAAAGARLDPREVTIGERCYTSGHTSGITQEAWDTVRETRIFLKAPITTPQGKGYKSLNVTFRKSMGLFANVRACRTYNPAIRSHHPGMDVVIVRENEEDTYAGIEHQQTREVTQCLKLITRPGCERIVRYAFEYCRANGRKRLSCFSKDNIMKMTDGLFHKVFDEIGKDYPDIDQDHFIIDIGTARLADSPDRFDVIVTGNLYGDIISDVAAQIAGSVGLAGSANIGKDFAMFEAIHGSAPDISGQGIANPSGLLNAAVAMLVHLGQADVAERIENAWLKTLEDGVHTGDIANDETTKERVGTQGFAEAVISRLGQAPRTLSPVHYGGKSSRIEIADSTEKSSGEKSLLGVDVFLDWDEAERDAEVLGKKLEVLAGPAFQLKMITNRGVKVYPDGFPETFRTDHWRCRYLAAEQGGTVTHQQVIELLSRHAEAGLDFIKTEHLCAFDGERAYSLGQGE